MSLQRILDFIRFRIRCGFVSFFLHNLKMDVRYLFLSMIYWE